MDLQTFKQMLKDKARKDIVFQQFVDKYKQRFKTILGTVFAHKRYHNIDDDYGIDIERYFYDGFQRFVINDLETQKDNANFESWVHSVATKKAADAKHEVNKELIKELTEIGGPEKWLQAYEMILVEYDNIFNFVTYKYFADNKYKGKKKEIKIVIAHLFYIYRLKSGPNGAVVKNYPSWLRTSLKNFVIENKNREEIDKELGVDHYDITIPIIITDDEGDEFDEDDFSTSFMGLKEDTEPQDADPKNNGDNDNTEDGTNTGIQEGVDSGESLPEEKDGTEEGQETGNNLSTDDPAFLDSVQNEEKQDAAYVKEVGFDEKPQQYSWAREKINQYLAMISEPDYVEILRLRLMEEWSLDDIAEKLDIPEEQKYNRMNRAMVKLIQVALPDLRRHLNRLLEFHGPELKKQNMRKMAEDYADGKTIDEIAMKNKMTAGDTSKMIAIAYRELKKKDKKDPIEFSNEQQ